MSALVTVTRDEVRSAVAAAIGVEPAAVPDDENLVALGLDSLGMMGLVNRWRRQGAAIEFERLAARPTLNDWTAYLCTGADT